MTVRIRYRACVLGALRYRNRGAGNRLAARAHVAALRVQREGAGAQQRENSMDSKHVC